MITSFKNKSFIYDFAVNGGAIGSIATGIFLPPGALFLPLLFMIDVLTTFTFGAGATYEIGYLGNTTYYGPATTLVSLPAAPGASGPPFSMNYVVATKDEILFTIATNPITSGKGIFIVYYQEI